MQENEGAAANAGDAGPAGPPKDPLQKIRDAKENLKDQPFSRAILGIKVIQVLSAIILVAAAVIRVGTVANFRTWTGFMLTGYLFMFGMILLCVEFRLFRAPVLFYFMNYTWGKGVTYIFIGLLELFSGLEIAFIDIFAGLWFIIFGVAFFVERGMYRPLEFDYVESIIKDVQEGENTVNKALEKAAGAGAKALEAGGKHAAEKYR